MCGGKPEPGVKKDILSSCLGFRQLLEITLQKQMSRMGILGEGQVA